LSAAQSALQLCGSISAVAPLSILPCHLALNMLRFSALRSQELKAWLAVCIDKQQYSKCNKQTIMQLCVCRLLRCAASS
jgi:hypothetical protein